MVTAAADEEEDNEEDEVAFESAYAKLWKFGAPVGGGIGAAGIRMLAFVSLWSVEEHGRHGPPCLGTNG
jgi:hypothetical protein